MVSVFDEKTAAKAACPPAPMRGCCVDPWPARLHLGTRSLIIPLLTSMTGGLGRDYPGLLYIGGLALVVALLLIVGIIGQWLVLKRRILAAENLLRGQASLLLEAQRLAGVGSWVWNPETDDVSWSDEMFRIYRRDPARGPARYGEAEKLYPPDAWKVLDAAVKNTFTAGVPYELDCPMIREDGTAGWVVSRGEVMKNERGRIISMRGTVQDITERKVAEHALRESEDKFRTAFAKTAIGMAMTDLEGRFLEANAAYSTITGYSHEELMTMTFHPIIHPDDFGSNVELMSRMVSGAITDFMVQNRYLRKNGTVLWVRKSVSLARDLHGRPWRVIALIEDVTVQKRIEDEICLVNAELEERVQVRTEELEVANKELEAFSYSVSHDLRAPLRAVDGFSKALLEDCGPALSDEGRHYIAVIRKGAQNMGALIDDLLTFSRLSRLPLQKRVIETRRLVRDALVDLSLQQEGRQVEIRMDDDLPHCEGDPALLKQVWLNLLSNALKYTRQRSPAVIEISASRKDGAHVYHIKDNGAGFDMRYVSKLFGVFQRLHTVDEYEGTGVGLAIVQRIVHRHGGRAWAEARVNEGAAFYFSLPDSLNDPSLP
ncbi:MAG: hypothetical protein JWO94_937 [Verrucomicrobiaceae bacterium]|nr:hypothetical protein [Verrucomicrobiaceae bacterium]